MKLSQRERQVLELVAQGKLNKEIANELHISESTVKNHTYSLMSKLDAHNRTELAKWYWTRRQPSWWRRLLAKLGIDTFPREL